MKNIFLYKAYIVDFDGTIYFQKNLRIRMLLFIIIFFIFHPWKIKDFFIIYFYRKIREESKYSNVANFEELEFIDVAKRLNTTTELVKKIINKWMIEIPLSFIKKEQDSILVHFLNNQSHQNKKIIIYSDFPLEKKLTAINLNISNSYYSGDKNIRCLKPDNKGLNFILSELSTQGIEREEVLYLGDRYEKDGLCARRSGIDFIILDSSKRKRKKFWKEILSS